MKRFESILMLDENRHKRVLWLCNHNTLMDFEVPLLISLGYEVYVPKLIPFAEMAFSTRITHEYDKTLSIDKSDIEVLNTFNFYDDKYTGRIINLINKYFGSAFVVFIENPLRIFSHYFQGNLYYRVFGLAGKYSYSDILDELGIGASDNSYFAEAYSFLNEVERGGLKEKATYLPLGMDVSKYLSYRTIPFKERDKDILFVCPRIDKQQYYNNIYKNFKTNFKNYLYTIGGKNPKHYNNDKGIIGYLEDDEFIKLYSEHKVLFYHSTEPRHIHYPPFEAIASGIPVIFMAGGMLERLVEKGKLLPGRCNSIKEAKVKINRICSFDMDFIEQVLKSQQDFLYELSFDNCYKVWKRNLATTIPNKQHRKRLEKIGIILSAAYKGGVLTQAKNIIKMLRKESNERGLNLKIELIVPKSDIYSDEDFAELKILTCTSHREYEWKIVNAHDATSIANMYVDKFDLPPSYNGMYCYPDDNAASFTDLDYWLILSDRIPEQLIPLRRYSIIGYDYLQRYFNFLTDRIQNAILSNSRGADCVFTTTTQTLNDAISFLGLPLYKAKLLPMEFSIYDEKVIVEKNKYNYFLWVTNPAIHKNHINIAKALSYYYNNLAGNFRCVISGVDSDALAINAKSKKKFQKYESSNQVVEFREIISKEKVVNKLEFVGYSSDKDYATILQGASFTLHGNSYDNGSFSIIEAAYYGVPSVATAYPAIEYINKRFNLNLLFCNSNDYKDIALKLKEMEVNLLHYKSILPTKDFLSKFNWENTSKEFFDALMECILI